MKYEVDWYAQPLGSPPKLIKTTVYDSLEEADIYIENFYDIMSDPDRSWVFEYAKERNFTPSAPREIREE